MVISGVISKVTIVITHSSGLITPLITTHEPPNGAIWEFLRSYISLVELKAKGLSRSDVLILGRL